MITDEPLGPLQALPHKPMQTLPESIVSADGTDMRPVAPNCVGFAEAVPVKRIIRANVRKGLFMGF